MVKPFEWLLRGFSVDLGIDEGIILTTFFVMIGAIMLVVMANKAYGA